MDSGQVATCMRGPGMSPALMASRSDTSTSSLPPTSRQLVKPASSVARTLLTPVMALRAAGLFICAMRSRPTRPERCVWQSIRPGSSVASPRSVTASPDGALDSTDSTESPETTTHTGPRTTPAFTSTKCAARTAKRSAWAGEAAASSKSAAAAAAMGSERISSSGADGGLLQDVLQRGHDAQHFLQLASFRDPGRLVAWQDLEQALLGAPQRADARARLLRELGRGFAGAGRCLGEHRGLEVVEFREQVRGPGAVAAARERHARIHQLAHVLARGADLLGLVRARHQRGADREPRRARVALVRVRTLVGDLEREQLDARGVDPVPGEETPHRALVGGELVLRRRQLHARGDDAHRPQRDVGLHRALGHALYRDRTIGEPEALHAGADGGAGEHDSEREDQDVDQRTLRHREALDPWREFRALNAQGRRG